MCYGMDFSHLPALAFKRGSLIIKIHEMKHLSFVITLENTSTNRFQCSCQIIDPVIKMFTNELFTFGSLMHPQPCKAGGHSAVCPLSLFLRNCLLGWWRYRSGECKAQCKRSILIWSLLRISQPAKYLHYLRFSSVKQFIFLI